MNKAYKYRIYPNKKQIEMFSNTFGSVRFVYNKLLNKQEESNEYMSKVDSNNYCNRVLKIEYPWLKEVDKFSLTNSIFNLNEAYKRYFNKLFRLLKFVDYKSFKIRKLEEYEIFKNQSSLKLTGLIFFDIKKLLALENGLLPKKPFLAENGEG